MSARHLYPARTATTVLATLLFAIACHEGDQPTEPSARVGGRGGTGGPAVNSVVPNISLPGVTLDLTVNGSGFDQGSTVRLERAGVPASGITTNSTTFINPKKVIANITIVAAADTGKYDVALTTSTGRKGVGIELFTVAYVVDELGIFGGNWSRAHAINDLGEVVGESCLENCLSAAFYWTEAGGMVNLGTLPGYTRSAAYAITNSGHVYGKVTCQAEDAGCGGNYQELLVRWDRSGSGWAITPVQGCRGVSDEWDGALAVNNHDQCVQNYWTGSVWMVKVQTLSGGSVTNEEALPSVFPGGHNTGLGISDGLLVVGQASAPPEFPVPVIWYRSSTGSWTFLRLSLPGTYNMGWGSDVSEPDASGMIRVAGSVQTAIQGRRSQDAHAVRWTLAPDGSSGWREVSVELLPGTAGGPSAGSFAFAVNLHGDAVGVGSGYTAGGIPVIWPVAGGLQELPTAAGGGEGRPVDINRDGWIVGAVYDGANKCDRAAIWRLR